MATAEVKIALDVSQVEAALARMEAAINGDTGARLVRVLMEALDDGAHVAGIERALAILRDLGVAV